MNWLDTPPCGRMDVKTSTDLVLELEGPPAMTRAASAGAAAFGATFATFALRFARLPAPGPFKLIPLVLGAVGGGVAALGLGTAVSTHHVRVTRAGISLRWRWGPLSERSLELEVGSIRGLEVESRVHESTDGHGFHRSVVTYVLQVVTKDGKAHAIEEFGLSTQATMRKEQVERLLAQ